PIGVPDASSQPQPTTAVLVAKKEQQQNGKLKIPTGKVRVVGALRQDQPLAPRSARRRARLASGHSVDISYYSSNAGTPSGSSIHGSFERVKMWASGASAAGSSSVPTRTKSITPRRP